jgi:hypothetical protein
MVRIYHQALLLNTRFVESTWDEEVGSYRLADFHHVAVLGNAVLLKYGEYDPGAAGVSAATLRDHTLRTIVYAAARNRWVDPRGSLTRWTANMGGLPPADLANPAFLNGRPVSGWNRARNVWDTFIVENHGSYNPIYQQSMGAYPGRNGAQFLLAGRPVPEEQPAPPNNDPLWTTMGQTGMDSGVPQDFMVDDRHHLYGRQLLPLTARAVLAQDPYAAAAESMLADRLIPYVRYPPADG